VPIEKLNRLSKNNHQGVVAQISPIEFHDLEHLILKTLEFGKTPLFLLLDQNTTGSVNNLYSCFYKCTRSLKS